MIQRKYRIVEISTNVKTNSEDLY